MIVKETLRLYPPISRIGRRPRHDIDLGTLTLPRDAAVFLSPYVTQRDPRWFVDPDEFRPDRWAERALERPRFAWFPFGAGPRSCIGEHFAVGVLVLTLATLAQRWKLEPATTTLPGRRSLLTLKPRGTVWMNARLR
jgi:cytochrome P450